MKVQIINKSKHPLPAYATEMSAGMDLRANLSEPVVLKPLERCLFLRGFFLLCRLIRGTSYVSGVGLA